MWKVTYRLAGRDFEWLVTATTALYHGFNVINIGEEKKKEFAKKAYCASLSFDSIPTYIQYV